MYHVLHSACPKVYPGNGRIQHSHLGLHQRILYGIQQCRIPPEIPDALHDGNTESYADEADLSFLTNQIGNYIHLQQPGHPAHSRKTQ